MFEWQKHSQDTNDVPHYSTLLEFLNLRAQASESLISDSVKKPRYEAHVGRKSGTPSKAIASFAGTADTAIGCILCETEKHPLYACTKFKALPHERMIATLKSNKICMNCLRPDHFVRQCKSNHRCKKCQKPHHTLLHIATIPPTQNSLSPPASAMSVPAHAAMELKSNALFMTSRPCP